MATITEDYVSFKTAFLLKEKGFNAEIDTYYSPEGEFDIWCPNERKSYLTNDGNETWWWKCIAPSQSMAMKWLREKYNIYISIQPDFPSDKDYKMCWCCSVDILHEDCISTKWYQCYIETYEKACETAILFCLKNLI